MAKKKITIARKTPPEIQAALEAALSDVLFYCGPESACDFLYLACRYFILSSFFFQELSKALQEIGQIGGDFSDFRSRSCVNPHVEVVVKIEAGAGFRPACRKRLISVLLTRFDETQSRSVDSNVAGGKVAEVSDGFSGYEAELGIVAKQIFKNVFNLTKRFE